MAFENLIGTVEAAEILGLERSTLSRWVKEGRLRVAKRLPGRNGAHLFDREDIEAKRQELAGAAAGEGAA